MLSYSQINYEIYTNVLYRLVIFACIGVAEPKRRNRKVDGRGIDSVTEFRWVTDSLQISVNELSDCPVIFSVKKPQYISSGFGMRKHPIYKLRRFHTGVDIVKANGTPVCASGNGVVIGKGYCSGYGNYIEVKQASVL